MCKYSLQRYANLPIDCREPGQHCLPLKSFPGSDMRHDFEQQFIRQVIRVTHVRCTHGVYPDDQVDFEVEDLSGMRVHR